MTIRDLITQSLEEINAVTLGQPAQPEVFASALDRLNMMLDQMIARERTLFADVFSQFNITPNLQPHTIGPGAGATWAYATARPQRIRAAALILNSVSAPYPFVTLTPLTAEQWQALSVPALASSVASYFYYNPTVPNGEFYFWTKETTAYAVQLQTRQVLAQVTANTTFAEPPGYWEALMRRLAKMMVPIVRKSWTPDQETLLVQAELAAYAPNGPDFLLETRDVGIPETGDTARKQDFNYLSGQIV